MKMLFHGKKKKLMDMLQKYCRQVDEGKMKDRLVDLIKVEGVKKQSWEKRNETLTSIN